MHDKLTQFLAATDYMSARTSKRYYNQQPVFAGHHQPNYSSALRWIDYRGSNETQHILMSTVVCAKFIADLNHNILWPNYSGIFSLGVSTTTSDQGHDHSTTHELFWR